LTKKAVDLGGLDKEAQLRVLSKAKKMGRLPRIRFTIRTKQGKTRYCYATDKESGEQYCKFMGATILGVKEF
jgi:hypothetical protein